MDDKSPKISFIPKASLVREESFLERPRPRSAIGILAVLVFLASAAGYLGLYFYNNVLENQISARLARIQQIEGVFSGSQQVEKANNFRFRANIVQQLLNTHISVTPILKFLSENTVSSIMYTQFTFTRSGDAAIVKLNGEAPTYAALAYQREVFKQKTKELTSFNVSDVALTSSGSVLFTLTLSFAPSYLSYTNNINSKSSGLLATTTPQSFLTNLRLQQNGIPTPPEPPAPPTPKVVLPPQPPVIPTPVPVIPTKGGLPVLPQNMSGSSKAAGTTTSGIVTPGIAVTPSTALAPVAVKTAPPKPSFWAAFFSWFKFW